MTEKQIHDRLRHAKGLLLDTTISGREFERSGIGSTWIAAMADINDIIKATKPASLPALGKVDEEGISILDMDFTHLTTGLGWPAFDTNFGAGDTFLAPEDMVVDTKDSSAHPGEAIYCTGASGIRYWFAHLQDDHPLGKKFLKGQVVGKTIATNIGGGPHLHLAINIIPLTGRHARYGRDGNGPNYTHGPYTLRTELLRGR